MNVVGVDAILHSAEPGVVNALGEVGLVEMNQHQDSIE